MRYPFVAAICAALAGCAGYSGSGLVPGQSSAQEVEALMGAAAERRAGAGGESVLYFPGQPHGRQTFAARIGPDGKLLVIEQRLTEANIARLRAGVSRADDVRDLFGPPYEVHRFPRLERETWTYKMYGGSYAPKDLYVQMSRDGIVREAMMVDDPQYASQEHNQ